MSANKDLHHNIGAVTAIPPQALGVTGTGKTSKVIDRSGFDAVEFVFNYGAVTATNATVSVQILDGSTTGALTAVSSTYILGSTSQAGVVASPTRTSGVTKNYTKRLGYIGINRYVQCKLVPTVSGGIIAGASVLLGTPRVAPVA